MSIKSFIVKKLLRITPGTDAPSAAGELGVDSSDSNKLKFHNGTDSKQVIRSDQLADLEYDNTASGLAATDPAAAIDEVEARLDTAESDIAALETLADGKIYVGNVSNVATEVTPSGDVTISNTGVTAISAGVIVDADINASAAIDATKIAGGGVTNTEFGYIGGLTSDAQTQLDGKATTTLNNLGTTSINASLIPDTDTTYDLGSDAKNWSTIWGYEMINYTGELGLSGVNGVFIDPDWNGVGGTKNITMEGNVVMKRQTAGSGPSEIRFVDNTNTITNHVGFKAPTAVTTPTVWKLPTADGTSGQIIKTDASANLSWGDITDISGTLSIAKGGSGQTTANSALNAFLPDQSSNSGKFLTTNGSNTSWASPAGSGLSVVSKTSAYTVTTSDDVVICSSANFNLTLYAATGNTGKCITIIHQGASDFSQYYRLYTTGGETIDGYASGDYYIVTNGEVLTLISNGSNWIKKEHHTETEWIDTGGLIVTASTPPGKGTIDVDALYVKRSGRFATFRGEYKHTTAGSAGSGDYIYSLPTNLAFASEVLLETGTVNDIDNLATPHKIWGTSGVAETGGASGRSGGILPYDTTSFRLLLENFASALQPQDSTFFDLGVTAIGFSFEFTVPIHIFRP